MKGRSEIVTAHRCGCFRILPVDKQIHPVQDSAFLTVQRGPVHEIRSLVKSPKGIGVRLSKIRHVAPTRMVLHDIFGHIDIPELVPQLDETRYASHENEQGTDGIPARKRRPDPKMRDLYRIKEGVQAKRIDFAKKRIVSSEEWSNMDTYLLRRGVGFPDIDVFGLEAKIGQSRVEAFPDLLPIDPVESIDDEDPEST